MGVLLVATTPAECRDFDEELLKEPSLLKLLNGLSYTEDSVIPYLRGSIDGLEGGYLRLRYDSPRRRLALSIELHAPRRLKPVELKGLKQELAGQISDGIGAGAFDELSEKAGVSIAFPQPEKLQLKQQSGKAWDPPVGARGVNAQKFKAIAEWIKKRDAAIEKAGAKAAKAAKNGPKAGAPAKTKKPKAASLKAFFRLLDKSESLADLKVELERAGGDLSGVVKGQFPFVNFRNPEILKLLLEAGLPPETVDQAGHHLLYLALDPDCVRLLVERGADVNRPTDEVYRATALMRAAHMGHLACVRTLLELRADAGRKDFFGQKARDWATKRTNGRNRDEDKIVAALSAATKK